MINLKNLFGVMFLLACMIPQIASAEIDWNSVPHFSNKAQLARYIEEERRKGNNTIRVILTNGLRIKDKQDFANISICLDVNGSWHINEDGTMRIDYTITEYPGTHVANAYFSKFQDIAWKNLSYEEKLLYSEALSIVNEANKLSSEIEKACCIHDEICKRVEKFENMDAATAINALIYGKTDCEGFMDAFYTIGRIAGLNVGRIRGSINYGKTMHGWNWITLDDGKTYFIDVSQDWVERNSNKYKYFIVPSAVLKNSSYWCHWEIIPNLQ